MDLIVERVRFRTDRGDPTDEDSAAEIRGTDYCGLPSVNNRRPLTFGILEKVSSVSGRPIRSRATQGRLIDPAEYLAATGHVTISLVSPDALLAGRGSVDVLFASRPLQEIELESLDHARRNGIRVVVDLADNHTINPSWSKLNVSMGLLDRMIGVSDVVSVTNASLVDVYEPYGKPVRILRTGFYSEKYVEHLPAKPDTGQFLVTMCNGDNLKSENFAADFAGVVYDFIVAHPDSKFHYFGDDPFPAPHSDRITTISGQSFLEHKLALSSRPYSLAIMMIGNRENADDVFTLGKSAVKYWEHGAFGIPGIYSDGDVYRSTIRHGVNGLLAANTVEDWREKLEYAYRNRDQLTNLGEAARDDVLKNYHVKGAAQDLYDLATLATK